MTGFEPWRSVARYLSVTEAPHNIESLRMSRGKTFSFFETWMPEWGWNPRSPTLQAGSFNQCPPPPCKENIWQGNVVASIENVMPEFFQWWTNVVDVGSALKNLCRDGALGSWFQAWLLRPSGRCRSRLLALLKRWQYKQCGETSPGN